MMKNKNTAPIHTISRIAAMSRKKEDYNWKSLLKSKDVTAIRQYLNATATQAIFYSFLVVECLRTQETELEDLMKLYNIPDDDLVTVYHAFEKLRNKGWLRNDFFLAGLKVRFNTYSIPKPIMLALTTGRPVSKKRQKRTVKNLVDILAVHSEIMSDMASDDYTSDEYLRAVGDWMETYAHVQEIQILKANYKKISDIAPLFLMAYKLINGETSVSVDNYIGCIENNVSTILSERLKILKGKSPAFMKNWVEIDKNNFSYEIFVKLTPLGIESLFPPEIRKSMLGSYTKFAMGTVTDSKELKPIKLFFNSSTQSTLGELESILLPDNYQIIANRFDAQGMKRGFPVLLYGHPGTGKTEWVYQAARQTGRDIFHVELSSIRGHWVGQSEKNTARIFEEYDMLKASRHQTPILLLNECDALLAKRINIHDSVDQMHNTMQNIFLEKLENFDGILVATSNLANNLDEAFMRRFLFKIPFSIPNEETRLMIWKSLIPECKDNELAVISDSFPLSGGQIFNVVKKFRMTLILQDLPKAKWMEMLISHCQTEDLEKPKPQLGFQSQRGAA